jgi:hypothetical protein
VIAGIAVSILAINDQDSSPSIVVAMNNPDETAVVGMFPQLLIEGWTLTDVTEDFGSVEYRYETGDADAVLRIEFGDQDDLNAAIADTVADLKDPDVSITGDEKQQIAILGHDGALSFTAVWGDAGHVLKMDVSGIGSFDGVRSVLASLSVADDAQWAEAQAGLAQP